MAIKNPWATGLANGPLAPDALNALMQRGKQNLQSGAVSLPKAAMAAKKLAPMLPKNMLSMANDTPVNGPLDMNANLQPDPAADAAIMASRQNAPDPVASPSPAAKPPDVTDTMSRNFTRQRSGKDMRGQDQVRAAMLTAGGHPPTITGYQPALDEMGKPLEDGSLDPDKPIFDFEHTGTDEWNPIYQQQKGVDLLQNLAKAQADSNVMRPTMDWTPLAKLTDAWSLKNPHLAEGMTPPDNGTDKTNQLQFAVQKQQAELSKDQVAAAKQSLEGPSFLDKLAMMTGEKSETGKDVYNRALENKITRGTNAHNLIIRAINSSPVLRSQLQSLNVTSNVLSNLVNVKQLQPAQIQEFQGILRSTMQAGVPGARGSSEERKASFLRDVSWNIDELKSFIGGNPADIAKDSTKVSHLRELATVMQQNFSTQADELINAKAAGASWVYNDPLFRGEDPEHPYLNLRQAYLEKVGAEKQLFNHTGATHRRGGQAATDKALRIPGHNLRGNSKDEPLLTIDQFHGLK